MAQRAPPAGEQSKAAFAQAAQGSKQDVIGAVVEAQGTPVGWLLERRVDAVAGAFVAAVGQRRQVQ
jgi:hypothetical protein